MDRIELIDKKKPVFNYYCDKKKHQENSIIIANHLQFEVRTKSAVLAQRKASRLAERIL